MCETMPEHRVISSLFNVVIQTQRQMNPLQNTVRGQGDFFTVQCCHSDLKADGPPWSTLSVNRVISSLFNVVFHTQWQMDPPSQHRQSTEWSLHCSILSFILKGRWTPYVQNTARAQSDLFTVQCCHSDPKTDGPPWSTLSEQSYLFTVQCCHSDSKTDGSHSQHCQSTEWSLHCSMLSFRLKGRWTPYVQNTARAQSDLFTVQCCHWASKADGPPGLHCQSTELSLHCSMLSFRLKGRLTPPSQHCQNTELFLHCSMLSFRLKGRWTPCKTLSEHRVISSLFNVVIQTQRQMETPGQLCQSRVISSLFNVVIQTQRQMDPTVNIVRAQSYLFTVQCCHSDSKAYGPPMCKTLPEHRVISSLFNVVIQTQRQMATRVNTVRAQSYLFTVQCCHSDSKAEGPPQSTLSEHRVISSLFNVVIETQRQMDLTSQHCQSTEWSLHCSMLSFRLKGRLTPPSQHCQNTELFLHCSMLSFRLKGRWTPCKTLSEHRVISSLFNVVIQTQRQMETPGQLCQSRVISSLFNVVIQTQRQMDPTVNIVRAQSYLFTVQCCHSDSKAYGPPMCKTLPEHRVISSLFNIVIETQTQMDPTGQHCQSTEWSLHCSMLSFRLKGRWPPEWTLSEHRVISSLFNVVIQTQRQRDPPVNTVRAQSDLFTVQCCHWDSKADGPNQSTLSEHRVISSLFNVVIQTQR